MDQGYDRKRLLILVVLAVSIVLLIIIASVIAYLQSNRNAYGDGLKIQNYDQMVKNLPSETHQSIEASLYNIVKQNSNTKVSSVKDTYIRKDSAKQDEVSKGKQYSGSFIVDIESLKQSYRVAYAYSSTPNDGFMDGYPINIICLNPNELIYGEFDCKGTTTSETATSDPILKLVPHSTLNYKITPFLDLDRDRHITLTVTLLLTEADRSINEAAAVEQYKAEALEWLNTQGLDLSRYTINYVY